MPEFSNWEIVVRLIISCIMGGLIGLERESLNKSAGFRTHILVCVGSALMMIVSQDLYFAYKQETSLDPGRIAAQVVSGIGFLGAGTILREGISVKGLTTAASLWVVSGVGLAVGAGFYFPAFVTTGAVFITLIYLGKVERLMIGSAHTHTLVISADDYPEQIGLVASVFGDMGIPILNIHIDRTHDDQKVLLKLDIKNAPHIKINDIIYKLSNISGINHIELLD